MVKFLTVANLSLPGLHGCANFLANLICTAAITGKSNNFSQLELLLFEAEQTTLIHGQ
jgi:hypothetical protein